MTPASGGAAPGVAAASAAVAAAPAAMAAAPAPVPAAAASARTARLPLDPALLAGAEVFTAAEAHVAAAAQAAGLAFVPDPRPLPPQVLVTLDTAGGDLQKRNGLVYWRGEMLPDQLAPGETGTLVRRHRSKTGADILAALERALNRDPKTLPKIERERRNGGGGATVELMKVLLRQVSEGHGVAARMIATSDDLEAICHSDKADVPALKGWRRQLFGRRALELKHGRLALTIEKGKIAALEWRELEDGDAPPPELSPVSVDDGAGPTPADVVAPV